jgi:ParB family chromosome partitioning protein
VATICVDPFRCRVWALHDRLEECLTEKMCANEIKSIQAHGQLLPALGRPLSGDQDYDVELIYGARRLFVARHLKQKLLIEVREMTDREAIIAMDAENRHRTDISPYERGLSYRRWLSSGYFGSQGEIARELNVPPCRISRLLKLAQLPAVIVSAFGNAANIREEWGLELADVLEDPQNRASAIRAARTIAARPHDLPRPREVFKHLLTAAGCRTKLKARSRDEVVSGERGAVLFRIRQQRDTIAVLLPISNVSEESMSEIRRSLMEIVQRHCDQSEILRQRAQHSDSKRRIHSELTSSD